MQRHRRAQPLEHGGKFELASLDVESIGVGWLGRERKRLFEALDAGVLVQLLVFPLVGEGSFQAGADAPSGNRDAPAEDQLLAVDRLEPDRLADGGAGLMSYRLPGVDRYVRSPVSLDDVTFLDQLRGKQ